MFLSYATAIAGASSCRREVERRLSGSLARERVAPDSEDSSRADENWPAGIFTLSNAADNINSSTCTCTFLECRASPRPRHNIPIQYVCRRRWVDAEGNIVGGHLMFPSSQIFYHFRGGSIHCVQDS